MPWINCPLQKAAQRFPNQPAIIFKKQCLSYALFHSAVCFAEKELKEKNIKRNTRVAIVESNSLEYLITLLALWRLGAVGCLLNPRLPKRAIQDQLKKIQCDCVLKKLPHLSFLRLNNITKINLNQNATILFTSGSSSSPKAVLHSFGNHYYNALAANEWIPLKKGDRWLLSLPLYHVSGLGILFRVLVSGATLVLPEKEETLLESLQKYRISHVSLVPTQLYRLLRDTKSKFPALKVILLGGAPIPDNLLRQSIKQKLPVHITYGLTEMASQVATSKKLSFPHEAVILKYARVKVSSDKEILVKGKTLFKGYVEGRKISSPFNKQGWFPTGDLGILGKNKTLKILGRKDNMFISGGENIQPEEIERYLQQMDGIEDALVVAMPDKEFGFRPAAFIKFKTDRKMIKEYLRNYLRKFLPGFKIPDQFYLWPQNKRGKGGLKINRREFYLPYKYPQVFRACL